MILVYTWCSLTKREFNDHKFVYSSPTLLRFQVFFNTASREMHLADFLSLACCLKVTSV